MRKLCTLLALISLMMAHGQSQVTYDKILGAANPQIMRGMVPASDGGMFIGGTYKTSSSGTWIALLTKTDEYGNVTWSKRYQGNDDVSIFDMELTSDGGIMATGRTQSYSSGQHDVFLLKMDQSGNVQWGRTYGGPGQDWLNTSVLRTSDDGFLISASTTSYGAGDIDCYLIKTDAAGDTLWTRTIGGPSYDYTSQVIESGDGSLYVSGYTASFGEDNYDHFLARLTATGDTLWTRYYGEVGNHIENLYGLCETEDGNILAVGKTNLSGDGNYNPVVLKVSSSGDLLWTREWDGGDTEVASKIIPLGEDRYLVTGYGQSFSSGSDIFQAVIDAEGDIISSHIYGQGEFNTLGGVFLTENDQRFILARSGDWPDDNTEMLMIDSTGYLACNMQAIDFIESEIALETGAGCTLGSGAMINEAPFTASDYSLPQEVICTTECFLSAELTGVDLLCHGDSSGMASVEVMDAYGSVTYAWSNGDSTAMASGLSSGWTFLTVLDSIQCQVQDSVWLNEPDPITVDAVITAETDQAGGSISLTITGGVDPYDIAWGTGESEPSIVQLEAGEFSVVITDENLCAVDSTFIVPDSTSTSVGLDHVSFWSETNLYIQDDALIIDLGENWTVDHVHVHSVGGALVAEADPRTNDLITIPLSALPQSVYILSCHTANGVTAKPWYRYK